MAGQQDTILLAEADPVVRKALRRTLESSGYHILDCNTGEEAVDLCRRHDGPISLFLSDISLPGVRGLELVRRVTNLRPLTRVIFLTGEPEEMNARAGICPGCWLLVRKPFRPQELANALREFLHHQALRPCSSDSLTRIGLVEI